MVCRVVYVCIYKLPPIVKSFLRKTLPFIETSAPTNKRLFKETSPFNVVVPKA